MNKELLIRHIAGETTPAEDRAVSAWVKETPRNRKYYAELKNIWVRETMPDTLASEQEVESFHQRLYENAQASIRKIRKHLLFSYGTAAAAVVLLGLFLLPEFIGKKNPMEKYSRVLLASVPQEYLHSLYTEKGVKAHTLLPDSSTVLLNSGSRLVYPDKFVGETREVEFHGEGFFKVQSDSLHPMVIRLKEDVTVMVYGTEFNLNTFDEDHIEASLYSGKITLMTGSEEEGNLQVEEMKPNTQTSISSELDITVTDMSEEVNAASNAWTRGELIFKSTPLFEVAEELERWHGVEVRITDESIRNFKITGKFKAESIVQIADLIRYCAQVDYEYTDAVLYFKKR